VRGALFLGAALLAAPASAQQTPVTYGEPISSMGTPSIATAQVSVTAAASLVAPLRQGRQRVVFSLGAANDCYFGAAGVTASNGFRVKGVDGASVAIDTQAAVYAACPTTTTVSVLEQF
jgi:hypothetical protein